MIEDQPKVRDSLLEAALWFVQSAARLSGIRCIALIGSIVSDRPSPKDIDLVVYVADDADLAPLASTARRSRVGSRARTGAQTCSWQTSAATTWVGRAPGKYAGPGFVPHATRCTAAVARTCMTTSRRFDSLIRSSRHRSLSSGRLSRAGASCRPRRCRRW